MSKFKCQNSNKKERGQVALVVLLISAVALTLGLATSKRATTDTKIDTQEEELQRAFNAAESGIEAYVNNSTSSYTANDNLSSATVSTTNIGNATTIDSGGIVEVNKPIVFWLMGHTSDGNSLDTSSVYSGVGATLCAQQSSTWLPTKVNFYYLDRGDGIYKVNRSVYNIQYVSGLGEAKTTGKVLGTGTGGVFGPGTPETGSDINGGNKIENGIDVYSVPQGSCPSGYIPVAQPNWSTAGINSDGNVTPIALVVTPLSHSNRFAMVGPNNFPVQGMTITATGRAAGNDSQAGATRTVTEEYRWNGGLLEFLLEGVMTQNGIIVQ